MKYQIMIGILFTLLAKGKVSARELASKYDVSIRTIYRYVDEMTIANIPIDIARGASGGIYISEAFKLPKGMMARDEYAAVLEAIRLFLDQTGDPVLRSALEKFTAQTKAERFDCPLTGNVLVDGGTWGDSASFSERLRVIERAIEGCEEMEIDYVDRGGEYTHRIILPHLLVYKQSVWYVYAFCRLRGDFRLFKLGRIRTMFGTGKTFDRIAFKREDVPLSFWQSEKTVTVRLAVSPEALPYAEEWLGIENVKKENGGYISELTLPDDDSLVGKLLSAGAGITVLSPSSLRERIKKEAERISASYEQK